jgi:hypothetical protein
MINSSNHIRPAITECFPAVIENRSIFLLNQVFVVTQSSHNLLVALSVL